MRILTLICLYLVTQLGGQVHAADPKEKNAAYVNSLTADFATRDSMPQSNVPKADWFAKRYGKWGPPARIFPKPDVPKGVDPVQWKRDRVVEAAKHYIGLKYKRSDGMRGHFPARGCGLDCSNYVAWVYNYALGIQLSSDVNVLSKTTKARKLAAGEKLQKGDLIFLQGTPLHVVMYLDENHFIDSSGSPAGVQICDMRDARYRWCRPSADNNRFLCARRVIE